MVAATLRGRGRPGVVWGAFAGRAAIMAGTVLRVGTPRVPLVVSAAGAAMVSLGAAMIYTPAGVIIGGLMLLWIGTELHAAPKTGVEP